jgi:hypothetical protein
MLSSSPPTPAGTCWHVARTIERAPSGLGLPPPRGTDLRVDMAVGVGSKLLAGRDKSRTGIDTGELSGGKRNRGYVFLQLIARKCTKRGSTLIMGSSKLIRPGR